MCSLATNIRNLFYSLCIYFKFSSFLYLLFWSCLPSPCLSSTSFLILPVFLTANLSVYISWSSLPLRFRYVVGLNFPPSFRNFQYSSWISFSMTGENAVSWVSETYDVRLSLRECWVSCLSFSHLLPSFWILFASLFAIFFFFSSRLVCYRIAIR